MSVGQDLLDVPFPAMVSNLAIAIAQSQYLLDKNSIDILKIMGDKEQAPVYIPNFKLVENENKETGNKTVTITDTEIETSMIGAGFQPTFYQFVETIIEVKMVIKMTQESEYERKTKGTSTRTVTRESWRSGYTSTVTTTPVDARYSSKYNYSVEGSSLIRTRLVPMPPNSYMQRLLDMKAQVMQMRMELEMKKVEMAIDAEKAKIEEDIKKLPVPANP